MTEVIGIGVCIIVWVLLFKPIFKNGVGFVHSATCAFLSGGRYFHWAWNNEFEVNVKSGLKFVVWLALGGLSGYFVRIIINVIT